MKRLSYIFLAVIALCISVLGSSSLYAQGSSAGNKYGGIVEFDRVVYDFGDILVSDGPVKATFNAKNISGKAMVIYNVVSSCGCTDVEWTRQPIKAGASGTITATYSNDEGPYPFDKSLTVYISSIKQPIILRLRGETHSKKLSLSQMYTERFGNLGFKDIDIKAGNLSQGQQKSGELLVANVGTSPLNVTFKDVSAGLTLKLSQNPIPAGSTSRLVYTVTADRSRWGRNYYYATPVVNGKVYKLKEYSSVQERTVPGAEALVADPDPELGAGHEKIGIFAVTKENFSSWSQSQRDNGSQPILDESTYTFGKVKAGSKVSGTFTLKNQGKSTLKVYKADSESRRLTVAPVKDVAAGGTGKVSFTLDTTGMKSGETLVVVTLYTNSPLRPIVNLYLAGWIA